MIIQTLRLKDFRNYEDLTIEPSSGVNILFGQNGSGKTNVIEAIHYCALGKSHRTNQDREVVKRDKISGACGVTIIKKNVKKEIAIKLTPHDIKKKSVYVDRKKAQRLSSLMGQLQCVIFSPEDLLLIKEGPGLRRKYMDMMISQMDPIYFVELQKYQKALDQRNAILKECKKNSIIQDDVLEVFECEMAHSSQVIIPMRESIIKKIQTIASKSYSEISGRNEENFGIRYSCCLKNTEHTEEQVCDILKKSRREDVYKGTTSFGLHRDDIAMTLNEKEMKLFASQGQIRTAALSMKFAQIELYKNETGENPVLLLDDVMSELDMGRRRRLIERLENVQTFITCTDESDIELTERPQSFLVSLDNNNNGKIQNIYNNVDDQILKSIDITDPDFS